MKRLTKDGYYLTIAEAASKRSTCRRRNVGCVVVDHQGFIISTGYNGTAPGEPHEPHKHSKEECRAIHAEINALSQCEPYRLQDATVYLTLSPCIPCSRQLQQAGVKRVVFSDLHSTAALATLFLKENNIEVEYQPHILYEDV